MAVWPQTKCKKILNLAVAPRSIVRHYKHCERVYQGALLSSRLNKALSHIYNWQCVTDKLAICAACEKGHQAGPRALQHVLRLTHCGRGQNNINLPFQPRPPNFNSRQIFRLYGIVAKYGTLC